jgi:hypothetical protein
MKNFDPMNPSFEKMGTKRNSKKEKFESRKKSSHKADRLHDDYEEYFNSRYGNKLLK